MSYSIPTRMHNLIITAVDNWCSEVPFTGCIHYGQASIETSGCLLKDACN